MDAQRSRRTRDRARQTWYAYYRQVRFARMFGFINIDAGWDRISRGQPIRRESDAWLGLAVPSTVQSWVPDDLQLSTSNPSVH